MLTTRAANVIRETRRQFLLATAAAGVVPFTAAGKKPLARMSIGVTDWDLRQAGKVQALALAKSIGFDGVQISLGRKPENDKLPMDNAELQATYLAAAKKHGIKIDGTCLDALHTFFLKSDKLGQKYLADGIGITRKLKTKVMLIPMFGKGAPTTPAELDYVGDLLKDLGAQAQKSGVVLALEGFMTAEQVAGIIDRSKSKAVKMYYDIGITSQRGGDNIKEIRLLGKDRIGQIHLKDGKSYLGEGKIDMPAVMRTIADIGYEGAAVLETACPSGSVEADMKRNLEYVRGLTTKIRGS